MSAPSREQYLRECSPRRGDANPQQYCIPTWQWLVRDGRSAWRAREDLGAVGGPAPAWCFQRFGMSCTPLPDGRLVCIGGEHEDFYDADFFIYNDVVVLTPAGGECDVDLTTCGIDIFGYPEHALPPTDNHSATRIGKDLYVVGNLGYPQLRERGKTPVIVLDTETWQVREVPTRGDGPGWISRHVCCAENGTLVIAHGDVIVDEGLVANEHTFVLDLATGNWSRCAPRQLRRRYELRNTHGAADATEFVRIRDLRVRNLIDHYRTDHVLRYGYDIEGTQLWCEDWGMSIDVTVDGAAPDDLVDDVLATLVRQLSGQHGGEWKIVPTPESES